MLAALQVYTAMMDLCVSKFKESEGLYVGPNQAGYCLLRSQLLMAFHDNVPHLSTSRQIANEVLYTTTTRQQTNSQYSPAASHDL